MKKFTKIFLAMAMLVLFSSKSNSAQSNLTAFQVTVYVTLSTGIEPINVRVELSGIGYQYTNSEGIVVFDEVPEGIYNISAFKAGYDLYEINNTLINSDKVYNIVLGEKRYPPTCLDVDPLTLEATWCRPFITALDENFEDPVFPPLGWQALSEQTGWERTNDGSSGGWTIPPWDSYYAMTNDDAFGGGPGDGCCDYLITPALDLRESEDFKLIFDSFYNGNYGQLAFLEYSVDAGENWEQFYQLYPSPGWINLEIDLGVFCGIAGPQQVWFAFHADDFGNWASGWAIDNVKIQVPGTPANYIEFWVYLDTNFVGATSDTSWDFSPLLYGQSHTAAVAARYSSGISQKDYDSFTCEYLFPPDSLTGSAPDDAAILTWLPPLEYWPVMLTSTDGPKYSNTKTEIIPGTLSDEKAINRSAANVQAISNGNRDLGDVILSWPSPGPISLNWGICDDGANLWITDPNESATTIYQVTYEGENTGITITVSLGQSWVGDMVSDGEWLYGCLVGGPNSIVKVDLATGETVGTITGDWTITTQHGLAADFVNEEFYIGGWNSNQIWRTTFDGVTISSYGFNGVSGLAWHPAGGPDAEGSLWVVESSLADLVTEIDPNNGWETIQSFTIPNGQQNSGAGLELKISGDNQGALWMPNQSDNFVYLVDVEEPYSCCPPGFLPENLLGYNIYRNGTFVAYTPHSPPGEYVPQGYVDEGITPGWYDYTVTAVYDLTPYGLPGETAESAEEGPASITSCFCFELDFIENWDMGNFEDNYWYADGENWSVSSQNGNPSPAAEFTWDPIQTNYSIALESYPIAAMGMTEGKIWFDFDLRLDAVQPTGEEKMLAEVLNFETNAWSTVAEYSNAEGSFGWSSEHIDITSLAMNNAFRVRFLATGTHSIDILSWFVDNIHIYRECGSPYNLYTNATWEGILLNWEAPETGEVDEWIHWDDGVNSGNSIGTGNAVEFDVAARWEPSQLVDYEGASITEIAFFPHEPQCTYKVRIWIGPGANLLVEQAVNSPVIGEWNYVTLNTPVPVDITQELWVGYYVNTETGYPAGVDEGPAIDGYGNMMNFGGWQTLLQVNPDLDFNWNIAAHLVTLEGISMPLTRSVDPYTHAAGKTFTGNPAIVSLNKVFVPGNGSRTLMGYNIWRGENGTDFYLYDYTTETTYLDTKDDLYPGIVYCYEVNAIWESESDLCESGFSNEDCYITGISDKYKDPSSFSLNVYPNPADDHVFIKTSSELNHIKIFDSLGKLLLDEKTKGEFHEINTSGFSNGIYLLYVETVAGETTCIFTVQR